MYVSTRIRSLLAQRLANDVYPRKATQPVRLFQGCTCVGQQPIRTFEPSYIKVFRKHRASKLLCSYLYSNKGNKNIPLYKKSCSSQLLHPDWRKVPWEPYFGWTDSHQAVYNRLRRQVMEGVLQNIYYSSAAEHVVAGLNKDPPFLRGPTVTTVSEAMDVMTRYQSQGWPDVHEQN